MTPMYASLLDKDKISVIILLVNKGQSLPNYYFVLELQTTTDGLVYQNKVLKAFDCRGYRHSLLIDHYGTFLYTPNKT